MNRIVFFILLALVVSSCGDDLIFGEDSTSTEYDDNLSQNQKSLLKDYSSWNEVEKKFFQFERNSQLQIRDGNEPQSYSNHQHPLLYRMYNHMAAENERSEFVGAISSKIGHPLWDRSWVHSNPTRGSNLVSVPFAFDQEDKTTAIFTSYVHEEEVIISGYAREHILAMAESCENIFLLRQLLISDRENFSFIDETLHQKICDCEESLAPPTPPEEGCEWLMVELCTDHDTQTGWLAGHFPPYLDHDLDGIPNYLDIDYISSPLIQDPQKDHDNDGIPNEYDPDWVEWVQAAAGILPPHLDHDQDGILNSNDPNWRDFSNRFGVTQDEYTYYWQDYWSDNYADQYGEYDDFWSYGMADFYNGWFNYDNDNSWDYDGQWDYDVQWLSDLWEGMSWGFGYFWENVSDWRDRDIDGNGISDRYEHCNFDWWWLQNDDALETRTDIQCEWYYVKSCDGAILGDLSSWWSSVFEDIIPCPNCDDRQYLEYERDFQELYYSNFYNNFLSTLQNTQLFDQLLESLVYSCPGLVGQEAYNECFMETLIDRFLNYASLESWEEEYLLQLLIELDSEEKFMTFASKIDIELRIYPDYAIAVPDVQSFIDNHGVGVYLATATYYETFMEEVGSFAGDPYKWQLMMEVFYEELAPILGSFIPVVGDLYDAYNEFNDGNYWMGSLSIVLAVIPNNEIAKVLDKADDIRDGWKLVDKVAKLWVKLMNTVGGQKVLNKMPPSWKGLPGSKLADNQKGLKWRKDAFHEFRIMDADPSSPRSYHQYKYVRMKKNGNYLGTDGNYHQNDHSETFQNLTHIPQDQIVDSWLDEFFN